MKATYTDGRGSVTLCEVPEPSVGDGQIGINSVCSLISAGTELHYARHISSADAPVALGYCAAGIVREVGSSGSGFRRGDPVIAMGWGYAIHAERIAVPQRLCLRVRDETPLDQAVFANLAATAMHAVHRAGPLTAESRVLVIGAGLVGQLVARVARLRTAHVTVVDKVRGRMNVAHAAGFHGFVADIEVAEQILRNTQRQGVHVIFLCGGGPQGFPRDVCSRVLHRASDANRRGIIVCVGRFPLALEASAEQGNVDIRLSSRCGAGYRDDDYVHGRTTYSAPPGEATVDANLRHCLALIEQRHVAVADLITHRVPFAEASRAYRLLDDVEQTLGVILFHDSVGMEAQERYA